MKLKSYWPRYLQELAEFGQLADTLQPEFTTAARDVRNAPDDFFLSSLSMYGCARWESILGLTADPDDTVEQRREKVLIAYLDHLPYTWRALLQYLATISPTFRAELDSGAYELFISIVLSGGSQRDALAAALEQMIPANLVLLLQTAIAQNVARAQVTAMAGMYTMVRHEHHPEGG